MMHFYDLKTLLRLKAFVFKEVAPEPGFRVKSNETGNIVVVWKETSVNSKDISVVGTRVRSPARE